MMLLLVIFALIVVVVLCIIVSARPSRLRLVGSHVVITGGSSGIGLEIAKECARQGGFITLIARDKQRLAKAKAEVEDHLKGGGDRQCVEILPLDISLDAVQVYVNPSVMAVLAKTVHLMVIYIVNLWFLMGYQHILSCHHGF